MRPHDANGLYPGMVVAITSDPSHARTAPKAWVEIKGRPEHRAGAHSIRVKPIGGALPERLAKLLVDPRESDGASLVQVRYLTAVFGLYQNQTRWEHAMAEEAELTATALGWTQEVEEWKAKASALLEEIVQVDFHEFEGRDTVVTNIGHPDQLARLLEVTRQNWLMNNDLEVRIPVALLVGPMPQAPRRAS